ncbi:glutathione binding-like protein [Bradyrhizobium sp. USDA 4354]
MNEHLADKRFLMGDKFTVADVYLFALTGRGQKLWLKSYHNEAPYPLSADGCWAHHGRELRHRMEDLQSSRGGTPLPVQTQSCLRDEALHRFDRCQLG